MIDQLVKGVALFEGSNVHMSTSDGDLDYSSYIRLFSEEDAQEITVIKEDSMIYGKKYDKIIIILNLNNTGPQGKVGSHSFLLLRGRAICRDLNALYTSQSPQLKEILKYRTEFDKLEKKENAAIKDTSPSAIVAVGEPQENARAEKAESALEQKETAAEREKPVEVKPESQVERREEKEATVAEKAEPRVEKITSRYKKKEPLVVKAHPGERQKEPEAEKIEPQTVKAEHEKQFQSPAAPQKQDKPKLFDSLALGVYQGAVKKEKKKEKNEQPVPEEKAKISVSERTEPAVETQNNGPAVTGEAPAAGKSEEIEELEELAREIIKFKKTWADKKK